MLQGFFKKSADEKSTYEYDFPPNVTTLKKLAEENGTLMFYFFFGSCFGGENACLIIDNGDETCRVYAMGYNGFDLYWNFDMPIAELKHLIKILQPARKWLRNYEVQADIYDGYGWDLVFIGKDYIIKTSGYMANPRNYFRVGDRIIKQLTKYKNAYAAADVHEEMLPINGYKRGSWYNAGTKN